MKNGNGKLELTVYLNESYLRGYADRAELGWRPVKKELQRNIREAVDETGVGLDIIFDAEVCDPTDIFVTAYHDSDGNIVTDATAKAQHGLRVASGLRRRVAATVNDYLHGL
jgi:hypothetical protein